MVLERLADDPPPPSRVDIGLARREGRRRLLWRRAGAPALAVVAIIALFAGGVIPAGSRSSGPGRPTAIRPGGPADTAAPLAAPAAFNPLVPYAAFGWLPAGYVLDAGGTSPTVDYVTAARKSRTALSLSVYSAGTCRLSEAQVLRQVQRHGHAQLNCGDSASSTIVSLTGPVGAVHGRPAFRVGASLAWQYARGGWAMLGGTQARADMLKIANGVRFGPGAAPAIVFPVQLTGAPSTWHLVSESNSVSFRPYLGGVLRAYYWILGNKNAAATISVDLAPAPRPEECPAANRVVGGYRVSVRDYPSPSGGPPRHVLCAADADGLVVVIEINGRPAPSVTTVFAHHTRLLGPDPANWTTRPLG